MLPVTTTAVTLWCPAAACAASAWCLTVSKQTAMAAAAAVPAAAQRASLMIMNGSFLSRSR